MAEIKKFSEAKKLIEQRSVEEKYSLNRKLTLEEIVLLANVGKEAAVNCGVSPELAESLKIDSLINLFPQAKIILEPQKNAIASSNSLDEVALTPTAIGEKLAKRLCVSKISARAVNKKLLILEYQEAINRIKKSNGKETLDYYKPTEKALNGGFAHIELSTYNSKGEAGTKYQCRWFQSIVDVLAQNWQ